MVFARAVATAARWIRVRTKKDTMLCRVVAHVKCVVVRCWTTTMWKTVEHGFVRGATKNAHMHFIMVNVAIVEQRAMKTLVRWGITQ